MMKVTIFITLTIGIFYLFNKHSSEENASVKISESPTQELVKNKELHIAFETLLDKKSPTIRQPATTSERYPEKVLEDQDFEIEDSYLLSEEYAEKFKNEMSDEEKKEAIKILKAEINNEKENIDIIKSTNENQETLRELERKHEVKKQQLEYFTSGSN